MATYRSGIGLDGEVPATKLMLLKRRPLGVRAVTNPEAAFGADDPEAMEDARAAIPGQTRSLDRVVSLLDFEDFGRAYPGIGKARTTRLWDGRREIVHLTVASATGQEPATDLLTQLGGALRQSADPSVRSIQVQGAQILSFGAWLDVTVDGDNAEAVLAAVESALLAQFTFEVRDFGQAVLQAELIAIAHGIEGVVSVVVRELIALPDDDSAGGNAEGEALAARAAARELPEAPAPISLTAQNARADPTAPLDQRFTAAQLLLPHPTWGFLIAEAGS